MHIIHAWTINIFQMYFKRLFFLVNLKFNKFISFGTYTAPLFMSSVNKTYLVLLVLQQPMRLAGQQITHKIHLRY